VREVLDEGLSDPDSAVREAATKALEQLGEGPRS
jgi:HEAT repeat protein